MNYDKKHVGWVDSRLKRGNRYATVVSGGSEMSQKIVKLAYSFSDPEFRADFDNEQTQKVIEEGMAGLMIGADEQLGFFRASKIAHKLQVRLKKIDSKRLAGTPLASTVAHLHLRFLQEGKRAAFFTLIFYLDVKGNNLATAMIDWVDPHGNPVKGNVYM